METYLCFPDGASGAWFHGRVLASAASSSSSSSSASASASAARRVTHSLFAAQVVHQHECLAPADGSRLVSACEDNTLRVFDLRDLRNRDAKFK